MNDLAEHFARLDWVRGEIDKLAKELAEFAASDPIQVIWHFEIPQCNPWRIYRTKQVAHLPQVTQIHAGVIINELRAILDALACALAVRNGHDNVKGTYFPTGQTKEIFDDQLKRKTKKLSAQDRDTIATLRPFLGGNDLLYALHSSDIIRKHQRLIVLTGNVENFSMGSNRGWSLDGSKFDYIKAGQPIGEPFARLAPDYHIEFRFSVVAVFAEPDAIKSKPVVTVLNDFAGAVESILKLFA